jgi:hypothetical protein
LIVASVISTISACQQLTPNTSFAVPITCQPQDRLPPYLAGAPRHHVGIIDFALEMGSYLSMSLDVPTGGSVSFDRRVGDPLALFSRQARKVCLASAGKPGRCVEDRGGMRFMRMPPLRLRPIVRCCGINCW